jgi:hypothetical protein
MDAYGGMVKADGPGVRFGSIEVSDCAIAGDMILPMSEAGHRHRCHCRCHTKPGKSIRGAAYGRSPGRFGIEVVTPAEAMRRIRK